MPLGIRRLPQVNWPAKPNGYGEGWIAVCPEVHPRSG